eukprot:COSAG04_NODE_27049_length_287_cov_0.904255_1_plen_59_part_01
MGWWARRYGPGVAITTTFGHRMGKTDRPLYFRSFDAALRPLDTAAAASRWGWWTEAALR